MLLEFDGEKVRVELIDIDEVEVLVFVEVVDDFDGDLLCVLDELEVNDKVEVEFEADVDVDINDDFGGEVVGVFILDLMLIMKLVFLF